MSIRFHKVVGALPAQLEPDAVYSVRTGVGFDLYMSDSTGAVAHRVNSGAELPEGAAILWTGGPVPEGWHVATSFTVGSVLFEFIAPGEAPVVPVDFARLASTVSTRHMHSGHSLTDAYMRPDHEDQLRPLRQSIFDVSTGWDDVHYQSTIPGSPTHWRWNVPGEGPTAAVTQIGSFDSLVITEGGPPPLVTEGDGSGALESIFYLLKFADNTWRNGNGGAGAETIFWSIWPSTSMDWEAQYPQYAGNYRGFLDSYETRFRWRADWVEWKMRQIHPELPEDYRIWIIPGHRMIARILDDLAGDGIPDVVDIDQLLWDGIHANMQLGYGLACLVATMLYQVDLRTVDDVFIQNTVDPSGRPSIVTPAMAEYFHRIAWEICTTYEPCGMGGTDQGLPGWNPVDDHDYFPMIEAPADLDEYGPSDGLVEPGDPGGGDPGDLPAHRMLWTAEGYDGPTLTGPQPTATGGYLAFTSATPLTSADFSLTGTMYGCIAIRSDRPSAVYPIISRHTGANWNNEPSASFMGNGYIGAYMHDQWSSGHTSVNAVGYDAGAWRIVEWWSDGLTVGIGNQGGESTDEAAAAMPTTGRITLFGSIDNAPAFDVAALFIADSMPMPEQRTAIRAWALDRVPE